MPGIRPISKLDARSTDALLGHVNHIYGKLKSAEEVEFTNSIGEKFTGKMIPLFLMTLWVGIVSHSKVFMIIFQHPKLSRCVIPELEGHFSYEQILNLTVRNQDNDYGQYCYFDKRDYKGFIDTHGYDYDKLMGAISDAPDAAKEPCENNLVKKIKEEYDDIGDVVNSHDNLELYCHPTSSKRMMDIAVKYGQFLLSVPMAYRGNRRFLRKKSSVFGCWWIFNRRHNPHNYASYYSCYYWKVLHRHQYDPLLYHLRPFHRVNQCWW